MNTLVLARASKLVKKSWKFVTKASLNTRSIRLILSVVLLVNWAGMLTTNPAYASESPPPLPITTQSVGQYFDETLTQQMSEEHLVGATVSVVKDGKLLFAKGYGYADLAQKIPVIADKTLFYPGSAGKLFTWTAMMQLVEQGKLDLKTDINQYLDFVIPATFPSPITLEHLLTHTSGFEEQLDALMVSDPGKVLPLGKFVKQALPTRVYEPGTTFAYSNYATILAGYIVERISGEPYDAYITNHILNPLQMTRTSAVQPLPPELAMDFAKGYHYRNGQYTGVDFEWTAGSPAAPVRSTATDMAKFMIAHLNHGQLGDQRILQDASCDAMHQKQFAHDPRLNGMGYGFILNQQNGQRIAWHNGGSAHFNTILALIPAENVGFFVSYNGPVADINQTMNGFVDHFYPVQADQLRQPLPDTAQRITLLSGNYVRARIAHHSLQKLPTWFNESLTVQPGADNSLMVGTRTFREVDPGFFQQVDAARALTYRTNGQGEVTELYMGVFTFLRVPWYQTVGNQLIVAVAALLVMLTAALAWAVDWFVRRRRGKTPMQGWASVARWTVVVLGLFNTLLLGWFFVSLFGFADSFIFPSATMTLITWLWTINLPAVLALVVFTLLTWRNHTWRPAWRVHYTLVTVASVVFLGFLVNWNLLAV